MPDTRCDAPRATVVGHASALIQLAGMNLLIDPVWSDRASPLRFVGPRRVAAPGIAFHALPPIDLVLLSHNHYDHMDVATLRHLVARDGMPILTPLGNDSILRRAVPGAKILAGDWWDRHALSAQVAVTILPAQHWSARGIRDRRMALWGGFWLQAGNAGLYLSGDTGYGDGSLFATIRARMGTPALALLPIGAYEPRWFMREQHVDPAEAVRIFHDLGADHALGMHWGVFALSDEGRDDPPAALNAATAAAGIEPGRFVAAEPGQIWGA